MAKNDWQRIRSVFEDALQRPVEERSAYAQKLCGADENLWNEVRSMLDWHESSESFLEIPAVVRVAEDNQLHDQLSPGQRLLHYEIRKLIGKGGMGEVYLAHDARLDRNVAVKILRRDLLPDLLASERLLREARAAALLEHPNICHIHEISEADGFSFIVMQYIVGTTLDDILAARGIDVDTALDLGSQIAGGLAEAHSHGIIHRDIKPANIIVSEKGQAKILDFGLAKFIDAETTVEAANRMESTSGAMGTVPYMSPEQLLGDRVDARTDVFSFGTMLFEMFSGVSAFGRESNAETISAILNEDPDWSHIPPAVKPVLQRCLLKDKAGRYPSAVELAASIAQAMDHGPIEDPARSIPPRRNRVDAETQPVDLRTLPLYAWQSGADRIVRPSDRRDAEPRDLSKTNHRGWLVAAGSVLTLVTISFAAFLSQQTTPSPSRTIAVSPTPPSPSRTLAVFPTPTPSSLPLKPELITIPGGTFNMGRDEGRDNEKPMHSVDVKSFKMDKTEVTNAEYFAFINDTGYRPVPYDWVNNKPLSGTDRMPVRCVNMDDITAFVSWRSRRDRTTYRLPTEAEWEYAARNGAKNNLYPWGDYFDPRCPILDKESTGPTQVGGCTNQWGVVDLIGNVYEWTGSKASLYPGSKFEMRPTEKPRYMIRGGSALTKSDGEFGITSAFRDDIDGSQRDKELGFRLVSQN
jgi:serine/threonine protein kinase